MRTVHLLLHGFGHVGRQFVRILQEQGPYIEQRYGIRFLLTGIVDSQGAAFRQEGLELEHLLSHKASGRSVGERDDGVPGQAATCLLEHHGADLLLEASPTNLWNGQPGLAVTEAALLRGTPVVLASKGPLVVGFPELAELSDWSNPSKPAMRFSGAVGGGLPSINLGLRDLAGDSIQGLEAILNLTSQLVLERLAEGKHLECCLQEARAQGLLEADASLDVDGWDAAAKLVILANAVLKQPARLKDVIVEGLRIIPDGLPKQLNQEGRRMALLATAKHEAGAFQLRVRPTVLEVDHPFARLRPNEAAVRYTSKLHGHTEARWAGNGPRGTAAAMLRDALELLRT